MRQENPSWFTICATPAGDLDAADDQLDWSSEEPESTRSNREVLAKELHELDGRINSISRVQWLKTRRAQMVNQLGFSCRTMSPSSPLSHEASRWLVRLTGGTPSSVFDWSTEDFTTTQGSGQEPSQPCGGVTIDGHEEAACSPVGQSMCGDRSPDGSRRFSRSHRTTCSVGDRNPCRTVSEYADQN